MLILKKVPEQSDSIPLINVYFTICITFSLCSMIWFSIINFLKERKSLPNSIILDFIFYIMRLEPPSERLDKIGNLINNKLEIW